MRGAGNGYPQEVKDLYLQVAPGSIGTNARKLEDKVRADAASSAPFDLASQIVTELRSSTYTYATDVRDLDCATLSTAECFATYKRGFCQYYAATMAVLLRDLGVPTRIAEGFFPGAVDRNSGIETIPLSGATLGRGLLPGPWLGHVRPDRRQPVPGPTAAVQVRAASDRGNVDAAASKASRPHDVPS